MYKLNSHDNGILTSSNGIDWDTFIPFDESNIEYQEYLKWVEAGNTPLPADNIDNPPE